MKDDWVEQAFKKVENRVTVSCDEAHMHTAQHGCISGDKDAVLICNLVEEVHRLEGKIEQAKKVLEEPPIWTPTAVKEVEE